MHQCCSQPTECGMGKTLWAAGTPGMQQANQCPAANSAAGCAAEQRQQQLAVNKMNCGVCAGVRPPGAEMEGSPTAACAHRGMGLSWKSVAQGEAGAAAAWRRRRHPPAHSAAATRLHSSSACKACMLQRALGSPGVLRSDMGDRRGMGLESASLGGLCAPAHSSMHTRSGWQLSCTGS